MKLCLFYILSTLLFACSNPNFYASKSNQGLSEKNLSEDAAFERYYDSCFPSLLIYGGPPNDKDMIRQSIDEWYGFRYIIMSTRCTEPVPKGTLKHNIKTDNIMSARLGFDWFQKFKKSVDSMYTIDTIARKIALKNKEIIKWMNYHNAYNQKHKFYPNIYLNTYSSLNDSIRVVWFSGYAFASKSTKIVSMMRATIDLNKKRVSNIDSTAINFN